MLRQLEEGIVAVKHRNQHAGRVSLSIDHIRVTDYDQK
jgi:hypothetical protein